ncbi:MAG: IS66 family insertion sequence element accessory protein TnpB [Achromobacter sp.]|uniref:IS66-like element accessory protein TnpA n=1 Tax=Achromobacter sp. TaxID=134375 RepID=UPI0012BF47A9|nr:transposase [Achromobacter sp.]MPS79696.1 IS66 family insertion sequence element accessory protein TnpB [Achromobacter sp.]
MPKRRSYPKTLKAQIVAQCSQPGTSIAGVALSHGVNANLVHKWIRQAERQNPATPAFVPVALPSASSVGRHIEIRLSRGLVQAAVQWPVSEAGACVAWLREWLR